MADVVHAAADEHFVDLGAGDIRQRLDVVGVVRAGHDGLVDVGQVDLDHGGVVGVGVRLQQLGIGQPGFHGFDAAAQRAFVFIAVGDHPLQHHDVAVDVPDDRLFVQAHRAAGGRAFGRGVGQLGRLARPSGRAGLDFQDAAREDVLLPCLATVSRPCLMAYSGIALTRSRSVTPGCILPFEAHQHRFRHVQRHHAGRRGEGHQARAGGERNADREARASRRRCRPCRAAACGSATSG